MADTLSLERILKDFRTLDPQTVELRAQALCENLENIAKAKNRDEVLKLLLYLLGSEKDSTTSDKELEKIFNR